MKVIGSAAKTNFYLKKIQGQYPSWRIQYKMKCKSTENELTNWLVYSEIKRNKPVAIIAREQFSGFGQNSRTWVSPKGGIWLSAAYPIFSKKFASQIFNLSLGIKLFQFSFILESLSKFSHDFLKLSRQFFNASGFLLFTIGKYFLSNL